MVDKIIWLDGHTSSIAQEEAFQTQFYENNRYYMKYKDSTFVWAANCWMEVEK